MGKAEFASREWLGVLPIVGWSLLVAVTGGVATPSFALHAGFFWYLAIFGCLGSLHRWYLMRPDISTSERVRAMRRIALSEMGVALVFGAVLLAMAETGTAVVTVVVGLLVPALSWPWEWSLRRAERDRPRPYRSSSFAASLGFGAVLAALAVVNLATSAPGAIDSAGLAVAGVIGALALAQFIDAWDERRRPRPTWTPTAPPSGQMP